MSSHESRVWLTTGTSSGFGRQTARVALANGERVIATLRKLEVFSDFAVNYNAEQLLVLRLDVSKSDEIKASFAIARKSSGASMWYSTTPDTPPQSRGLEGMPDEPARTMFEVDFWGATHVSQEAVRFFRDENEPQGGRLIQNSAGAGLVAMPVFGFYAATKHGECNQLFDSREQVKGEH